MAHIYSVCCGLFTLVVLGQVAANDWFLTFFRTHQHELGVLTFCLFEMAEASVTLCCNCC